MPPQYVYTMIGLKKIVPPNREILKGVWLSFFWGAKIGVLGRNGAGKSTVLRIMAGEETDFDGKAYLGDGPAINSGFLDGLGVPDAIAAAIAAGRNPSLLASTIFLPDHIIEVDPETSDIVWQWHVIDHLLLYVRL